MGKTSPALARKAASRTAPVTSLSAMMVRSADQERCAPSSASRRRGYWRSQRANQRLHAIAALAPIALGPAVAPIAIAIAVGRVT